MSAVDGRWRPGPVHEEAARLLGDEVDEQIRADMNDVVWEVGGVGGVGVEDCSGGALVWPLSLVDDLGRRYELTVEVSVRPCPAHAVGTR